MLSFSQTTWKPKIVNDSLIVITPSQLKETNLIFLEHKQLKLLNAELKNQIENYQLLHNNSLEIESLLKETISNMESELKEQNLQINKQAITINRQKSAIKYITIGGAILASILLLK